MSDPPVTMVKERREKEISENAGGFLRGVGASMRGVAPALFAKTSAMKAVLAKSVFVKGAAVKTAAAKLSQARPLAFASEVGVASQSLIPRWVYLGTWGLSGLVVLADGGVKTANSPEEKRWHMALYQTVFHTIASLVVPAVIIHKIVHAAQHAAEHNATLKRLPPTYLRLFPAFCAILSIGPVVPTVDYLAEEALEPTLGKALGLEFHGHGAASA
eukprot:TRINITY_DN2488_c0_g1_i1.p2 TRINITY_DN2488_c0_g1~~TRINITY_DN2488_c0_g1_i1.p2  ORF type:complete len:216 (+),score=45.96 TRINITY_DN2488_c0_g1_i1:61-708(+)